ncbi:MAG: hypothetical protein AAFQ37_06135 [Bacteroidota bacterium]
MAIVANVKKVLFQRRLLREIQRRKPDYQPRVVNPDTAKTIAILFPADSVDDRKTVEAYRQARKQSGLRTELLGYFTKHVGNSSFGFDHFSNKDLNWYGIPGGERVEKFLERPCDLLMCLGNAGHKQLDFLASLKDAGLRVGPYSEAPDNPYDVLFSIEGIAKDLGEQLKQIDRIFKVTNATSPALV